MYRLLLRFLLRSSLPVLVRNVSQNSVDTEVRPVWKHSSAVGAVLDLVPSPILAETRQAEAVSTWYGHRVGEDVFAQTA